MKTLSKTMKGLLAFGFALLFVAGTSMLIPFLLTSVAFPVVILLSLVFPVLLVGRMVGFYGADEGHLVSNETREVSDENVVKVNFRKHRNAA